MTTLIDCAKQLEALGWDVTAHHTEARLDAPFLITATQFQPKDPEDWHTADQINFLSVWENGVGEFWTETLPEDDGQPRNLEEALQRAEEIRPFDLNAHSAAGFVIVADYVKETRFAREEIRRFAREEVRGAGR